MKLLPQCGRSVVRVLIVRVDIGVVTYEAMTPQCGRSVNGSSPGCQSRYRSGDLGSYDTQCGRSVVQVLVVRVDTGIGVVTYKAMTTSVGGQWFMSWLSEWT